MACLLLHHAQQNDLDHLQPVVAQLPTCCSEAATKSRSEPSVIVVDARSWRKEA